jgi:hypothetical protein
MSRGQIKNVSINADGWTADITVSNFGLGGAQASYQLDPQAFAGLSFSVNGTGFTETGAVTEVVRNIVATRVLREPYPTQGDLQQTVSGEDLVVRVALSDQVFAGETLTLDARAGFVTLVSAQGTLVSASADDLPTLNNSGLSIAQTAPIAQFSTPDRQVVTNVLNVEVVAASMFAKPGDPVASVRFIVTDQHGGRVEQLVGTQAVSTWGADDARSILSYAAAISTDGLRDGDLLTVRAEILPHIGAAVSSGPSNGPNPIGFTDQVFRLDKSGTFGRAYAYVDPEVAAGASSVSTVAAQAAATPFRTIGEALVATQLFNAAQFGRANVDNAEIRLTEGIHTWIGSAVTAQSVIGRDSWVTITSDPATTRDRVVITGALDGRNNTAFADYVKIENVTLDRTPMGASTRPIANGDAADRLWLHNVTFDGNDHRANSFLQGQVWVTQSDLNDIGRAFASSGAIPNVYKLRGVTADSATDTLISGHVLLGSITQNMITSLPNSPVLPTSSGSFIGFNLMTDSANATFIDVARLHEVRGIAIVGNTLTTGAAVQPAVSLSGDGHLHPVSNLVFHDNAVTGARVNVGYNDVRDQNHLKVLFSLEGNTLQQLNTKHDVFAADTDNTGAWSVLYGVGFSNNTILSTPASRNFNLEFDGLGSTVAGVARNSPQGDMIEASDSNVAPVASADVFSMVQAEVLSVAAPGVLANDRDGNGDELSAILVEGPSHGTASVLASGGLVYTPNEGFSGTETVTYRAGDGSLQSDITTITINVAARTDRPVALDDAGFTVAAGQTLSITAGTLLANDQNATGGVLSIASVGGAVAGTAELVNGDVLFTPLTGFVGEASFNYIARSSTGSQDSATVRLTVSTGAPSPDFRIVNGTASDDRALGGSSGRDLISGLAGADWLDGRKGDDSLEGGTGRDTLVGGAGDDTLVGGADGDQFRFDARSLVGAENDTIIDLNFVEGDTIVLASFGMGTLRGATGGNPLSIISNGTGAIIDSFADLAELTAQSPAVWAQAGGLGGSLVIKVQDADGDTLNIQINNGFAAFVGAGGLLLA